MNDLNKNLDARREQSVRPRLLGERAARQDLGIGRTKLFELIRTKQLDVIKIGRRTLIVSDSIDRLIERERARYDVLCGPN
jgi:hypothetical protein